MGQKSFDGWRCDAVLSTMGKLVTADAGQEMTRQEAVLNDSLHCQVPVFVCANSICLCTPLSP